MREQGAGRAWSTLAALVVAAAWFAHLAVFQVDDAFIVYRYAQNLAAGEGFAFNPGERVEGVTCFLWTLMLVPLAFFELDLATLTRWLTALCGLAAVALLPGVLARLRGAERPDAWDRGAALLLAVQPAFAYWSAGALETVPYALLLLLALRDHAIERQRGGGFRSALWAGLATLVRPEAPVILLGLAFDRLTWTTGGKPSQRLRSALVWGAAVAAFFAPLFVFRWLYFGDWLPNTYYAKSGAPVLVTLQRGGLYIANFLADYAPAFGFRGPASALVGGLLVAALLLWGLTRRCARAPAAVFALLLAVVALEGADWMPLHRFFVPGLPLLTMLAVSAGRQLVESGPPTRAAVLAFAALFVASQITVGVRIRPALVAEQKGFDASHRVIAEVLHERGGPDDEVALMDIGRIGYESGLRVFDITGLTQPAVARSPGGFLNKRFPVEDLLGRRPRFMVLVPSFRIDARILGHPDFERFYRPLLTRESRNYRLVLFERNPG